jgi:hypothetical protein
MKRLPTTVPVAWAKLEANGWAFPKPEPGREKVEIAEAA